MIASLLSRALLASWLVSPAVLALSLSPRAVDVASSAGGLGADYTCSKTKQCKLGCCKLNSDGTGNCGLGPTFCAPGKCFSTCDQKSQCDPGWGAQWSSAEGCPLKVCCSQYGFCGTTPDFCGSATVPAPSCGGASSAQRTIGYYEGWSVEHKCQTVKPDQITLGTYTHLNLAFLYIDPIKFTVMDMDSNVAAQYQAFSALKGQQPDLELWVSIGGWSFNDANNNDPTGHPTNRAFSQLAGGSQSQQITFFESLASFLGQHQFDGVDIDWEYPVAPDRSGSTADYQNYVSFLKNMRTHFDTHGFVNRYGISITLPSSYWYLQHFDIVNLDPVVDWFNVMTYDLHGTWDGPQDQIGSIALAHTNLTEIKDSLVEFEDLLWRNNIDPSKVNLGLGFYGRSFTLADPACKAAGCVFTAGGNPGPCTDTSGILSYTEIETIIKAGATVTLDPVAAVEIVTWDNNQWVSFDDVKTLKMKIDYANSRCLGGTMIWAVDLDADGSAIKALGDAGSLQKHKTYNDTFPDPFPDLWPGAIPTPSPGV